MPKIDPKLICRQFSLNKGRKTGLLEAWRRGWRGKTAEHRPGQFEGNETGLPSWTVQAPSSLFLVCALNLFVASNIFNTFLIPGTY